MDNKLNNPGKGEPGPIGSHEKFLELCAMRTSGELSEEERMTLEAHLPECSDCRDAMKEFEAAADIGVPLLFDHPSAWDSMQIDSMPAGAVANHETARSKREPPERGLGLDFASRNGHRHLHVNWNYVWMPFAAAVVLTVAMGIYSFQLGKHQGQEVVQKRPSAADPRVKMLEQQISDAGHERELFKAQLADRDRMIARLRHELESQSAGLNEAKSTLAGLEDSLQGNESEKQRLAAERTALSQQIASAQASLETIQAQLASLERQHQQVQSRTESLEAQIQDLHGQLRDREQALDKQEELLAHDRDIRELMGARDLYIAEVYDVARDGKTQKPYGRVFYTKGRSLIFYAYDLDQQAGLKKASTFQAWGSRGPDRQQAMNLGVFYEDNADKKRWVLKFDDPKKLAEIDAVFVTVEPHGGSQRPSGKPLLFAYLKVNPNHP